MHPGGHLEEHEAVSRLKHGDPGGLEPLVHRHQLAALRVAYLVTRDQGLAEDAVQETFLRLLLSIRSFDSRRPFRPWFMRSVVHAALRAVQKYGRELSLEDPDAEQAIALLASRLESTEVHVQAAEAERDVQRALERLSPRQRAVIVQRYYLEMTEAEMASRSGTAAGTIKWLLNAARQRLRGVLVERSDE
jgi:RNA polymerase sigma-70 factor (ECF subfamily)